MLLREYETIYILRPDMPEDGMASVNERLSGILDREGAKVLRHDVWGKKKLAFEVKKHPKGVYVYLNYLGKPEAIREIERNLRLIEPVLSYQTVKIAENVDVEKRMAEQEAENQARAAAEAQRKTEVEDHFKNEEKAELQFNDEPQFSDEPDGLDSDMEDSEPPHPTESEEPEEE